jgi:hypothetical protein
MWQRKATEMNFSQLDQQPGAQAIVLLGFRDFRRTLLKKIADVSTRNRNSDFHSRVAISEIISASAFRNDPD